MNYHALIRKTKDQLIKSAAVRSVRGLTRRIPRRSLKFEVHLAEHCNLNCKGCDNFSPLAAEEFLELDEYERDCRRLSDLFGGKVKKLLLLGGEPLLNPRIEDFLRVSRECFPRGRIIIVTNGLLLPKMTDKFWKNCKKYGIEIEPTKYPVNFDYDAVEEMARGGG